MWSLETLIALNEKAFSLHKQKESLSAAYPAVGINSSFTKLESFDSKIHNPKMEPQKDV